MVLMAVKSSWLATKDILHVSVRGRKEVQVLGQRREKRVTDTARAARKKGRARQAKSATNHSATELQTESHLVSRYGRWKRTTGVQPKPAR